MDDALRPYRRDRSVLRRKTSKDQFGRFSPSYGVHNGLIPDPNWPPVQFPENNVAMQRRHRRVACNFTVEIDGVARQVKGDISRGGALFVLPEKAAAAMVTVVIRGVRAEARVLSTRQQQDEVAHHAQFVDEKMGRAVWAALISR